MTADNGPSKQLRVVYSWTGLAEEEMGLIVRDIHGYRCTIMVCLVYELPGLNIN